METPTFQAGGSALQMPGSRYILPSFEECFTDMFNIKKCAEPTLNFKPGFFYIFL